MSNQSIPLPFSHAELRRALGVVMTSGEAKSLATQIVEGWERHQLPADAPPSARTQFLSTDLLALLAALGPELQIRVESHLSEWWPAASNPHVHTAYKEALSRIRPDVDQALARGLEGV